MEITENNIDNIMESELSIEIFYPSAAYFTLGQRFIKLSISQVKFSMELESTVEG